MDLEVIAWMAVCLAFAVILVTIIAVTDMAFGVRLGPVSDLLVDKFDL